MSFGGLDKNLSQASLERVFNTTSVPGEEHEGDFTLDYNADYDPERQASKTSTGRRMSRIEPVTKTPIEGGDADSGISVGAQIEMEKENAIRYRTCSWQKVWFSISVVMMLTISAAIKK